MNNVEQIDSKNKQVVLNNMSSQAEIIPQDVIIPRLFLMQGMSDLVKERKAQSGDIVRSADAAKIGGPEEMVEFIPLSVPQASWIIERKLAGQTRFSYFTREKRTAKNETMPWQFFANMDGNEVEQNTKDAIAYKRTKCLSLYVLIPNDIEAFIEERKKAEKGEMPDLSKALTPLLVEFRSTSFQAGKEITTYYTQAGQFGSNPSYYKLKLGCALESNGDNDFYVFKVDRSRPAPITKEQKEYVDYWSKIVSSGNVKVDEEAKELNTVNDERVPF